MRGVTLQRKTCIVKIKLIMFQRKVQEEWQSLKQLGTPTVGPYSATTTLAV